MFDFLKKLLSQNAFGYVLPITSFVVAWLETWFLDFKVLPQEADDERGGMKQVQNAAYINAPARFLNSLFIVTSGYVAAINAACERVCDRAPMIYPRAVSDKFYSPPESEAGERLYKFLVDLQVVLLSPV